MDISLKYEKVSSFDEAFEAVSKRITPEYIAKFKVKADVNVNAEARNIIATGKGFTLTMQFDDSKVEVLLEVSFLLKAFKKPILGTIEKELKRAVA